MKRIQDHSGTTILDMIDHFRLDATRKLAPSSRASMGQFMTPATIAAFMASLFQDTEQDVLLLDPGAGVGSLTAAFVSEIGSRAIRPKCIETHAFELDPLMFEYLSSTLRECHQSSRDRGIHFTGQAFKEDFVEHGVGLLCEGASLFGDEPSGFTHCIMNPPYRKIRNDSTYRHLIRKVGIETSNLYSAFMAIAIKLLRPGGELVAIVPRSFCNGTYFARFRELLLTRMAIRHLHVFDTRNQAFKEDNVLQENIILHAVKGKRQGKVTITSTSGPADEGMTYRQVDFETVVKPGDPSRFIHLAVHDCDQMVVDRLNAFECTLADLGLDVCTGPVVDFRHRPDIQEQASNLAFPLIYPGHASDHFVSWPKPEGKKPNAIRESKSSRPYLMRNGWYVLTRRFSAKEERRRIIAILHDPGCVPQSKVGFENHLNVYHRKNQGLDPALAKGLAVYLNSTLVDLYFRQFSGHTQVNASDLRVLRYPSPSVLRRLGNRVADVFPDQRSIDNMIDAEIDMKKRRSPKLNPVRIAQRIQEALSILIALGLPKGQRNERSALALLALLNLKPSDKWKDAQEPLMGITPMMDFAKQFYGKNYAPNTRETFRRQTIHQFLHAGLVRQNPDKPDREPNSPKFCYQIEADTLALVKCFGTKKWEPKLQRYLETHGRLADRYAKERKMHKIPLTINGRKKVLLAPGSHSQLIKHIINQFGPRYAPRAKLLYVGDTGEKMVHFDKESFETLGLRFDSHGKFPDVVLYFEEKNWLLLIESVTSHGPVDAKRHSELAALFAASKADLVFVTAFPDRQTMAKYLPAISWETEVWVADAPTHLIHFNGERFLGPHETKVK